MPATPIIEVLPPEGRSKEVEPLLIELSEWMDRKFELPGTGIRFGLDALLGLIPGIGDFVTFLITCYILSSAARYGVPRVTLARMGMNAIVDAVLGCIPIVGDVFDVAWKANTRNVELLQRTLQSSPESLRRHQRQDWLFVGGLIAAMLVVMTLVIAGAWTMIGWLLGWGS